jgi:hypothetical protein
MSANILTGRDDFIAVVFVAVLLSINAKIDETYFNTFVLKRHPFRSKICALIVVRSIKMCCFWVCVVVVLWMCGMLVTPAMLGWHC